MRGDADIVRRLMDVASSFIVMVDGENKVWVHANDGAAWGSICVGDPSKIVSRAFIGLENKRQEALNKAKSLEIRLRVEEIEKAGEKIEVEGTLGESHD